MLTFRLPNGEVVTADQVISHDGKKKSGYSELYDAYEAVEVGGSVEIDAKKGFDAKRTMKHNITNISSCIGKWLARNEWKSRFAFFEYNGKLYIHKVTAITDTARPEEGEDTPENNVLGANE